MRKPRSTITAHQLVCVADEQKFPVHDPMHSSLEGCSQLHCFCRLGFRDILSMKNYIFAKSRHRKPKFTVCDISILFVQESCPINIINLQVLNKNPIISQILEVLISAILI